MSPIAALKVALVALLSADAGLTGLLGGAKIHDDVPRGQPAPYVAFAEATARDNGSSSGVGHTCDLTLLVWSRQGGSKEALAIADRIAELSDDAPLLLAGHRLVLLRVTATEVRRQPEKDLTRVAVRLRAITEVI